MRTRTIFFIAAAWLTIIAVLGVVVVLRGQAWLRALLERPDPACVSQHTLDIKTLTDVVVVELPKENADPVDGDEGCIPPEEGASIAIELHGSSIEAALANFRPPKWQKIPPEEAQAQAERGEEVAAVSGKVGDRIMNVYAFAPPSQPDPVLVVAWFAD
ncbi:hypothetical protein GCM10009555_046920 [Acrocarpospora macrocephala]|uniref:Uncharacterized protein n=1 Tax=Acrocarpospora macrocephala TaxID=150177 RepID=A0A5M3WT24_9ACTN|nr:hypothetical protein [Acrocarpospora macrocephala]GES12034.1 hypothetical protein Amac_056310 [Acrocarpospora macrocephala]